MMLNGRVFGSIFKINGLVSVAGQGRRKILNFLLTSHFINLPITWVN